MPMRARSFGRSVLGSFTEIPSTVMAPCSNRSSPFTHLMSVDLPLPDGPQTTTTSPLATSVEQSVSTWKLPYDLLRSRIEIMVVGGASKAQYRQSRAGCQASLYNRRQSQSVPQEDP